MFAGIVNIAKTILALLPFIQKGWDAWQRHQRNKLEKKKFDIREKKRVIIKKMNERISDEERLRLVSELAALDKQLSDILSGSQG